MGCEVVLPFGMPLEPVRALFDERDARFSRFRPSSELARVNALPLGLTLVSGEFASMLSLSIDAARATDGIVTPTVGGAIVAAGYDRDFARLPSDVGAVVPAAVPSWHSISLHGGGLLRTETVQLDLNGVVKGRTVDDALAVAGRGWISAGGDVAALEPVVVGLPGRRKHRAPRRRARHVECCEAPLACGRCAPEPPDRPSHRPAERRAVARCDRCRSQLPRGGCRREGGFAPRYRPARRGSTPAGSPAASSRTTAT